MYSVMIVDDNRPVLNYLSKSVQWESLGLELKGCFSGSREALLYAQQHGVDIVVTDIGMPEMNGIELITQIKQQQPSLQSVIISCHGEFAYAQQAVKLGVKDYLLKENLTAGQLEHVLKEICERLEREQSDSRERRRLQEEHRRHRLLLKRKLTDELLSGSEVDELYGVRRLAHFGFEWNGSGLVPVYYRITASAERKRRFHDLELLSFAVENIVEEIAEGSGRAIHLSQQGGEGYIWISLPVRSHHEQEHILHDVIYRMMHSVKKFAKAEMIAVAGAVQSGLLPLIRQSILLKEQSDCYFYLQPSQLYRAPVSVAFGQESQLFADYPAVTETLAAVLQPEGDIHGWIADWLRQMTKQCYHPEVVKSFMLKLAIDWQLKRQQRYGQPFAIPVEQLHRQMSEVGHLGELEEWLDSTLVALAERARSWAGQPDCRPEIFRARSYVEQHMHRLVKLEEVADELHLNHSYFSRLFKRETGETFIEYVTRVKMERAQEWISSGEGTVEEVARMLGYQYKSYFLKLYKLYTGQSPVKSKGEQG